jgi:hypothetical protein
MVLSLYEIINDSLIKIAETRTFKDIQKYTFERVKSVFVWGVLNLEICRNIAYSLFYTVPKRLTNNLYFIDYFYNGKQYRIVFPINKFNDINVSGIVPEEAGKYLGPNNNFHNINITPKDIELNNITITYFKEEDLELVSKTFLENDNLKLD